MTRIILILLLIPSLCMAADPIDWSKPLARMGVVTMGAGVAATGVISCTSGSDTNFGQSSGTQAWNAGKSWKHKNVSYAAPGAGQHRICNLYMAVRVDAGTETFLAAVYDTSGNLVCQGASAKTAASSGTLTWTYDELKPIGGSAGDPCQVTGGDSYKFAASRAGAATSYIMYDIGASGDTNRDDTDRTGGFGDSLGDLVTDGSAKVKIWAGARQ